MATCVVSGVVKDISETAVQNAVVTARIVTPYFSTTIQIVPTEVSDTTDSNGAWDLTLVRSSSVIVTIDYPPNTSDSKRRLSYAVTVPDAATANFSTIATEL